MFRVRDIPPNPKSGSSAGDSVMGDAARRRKLGIERQSKDSRREENLRNTEKLREHNADRLKRAIDLWNQHDPNWDDRSFDRERIEDLSLVDRGIYVVSDNDGEEHCLDNPSCEGHPDIDVIQAVPIGGKRRGGHFYFGDKIVTARDVLQQLTDKPGFPNARIEKHWCGAVVCECKEYFVRWGDDRIADDHFPFEQPLEIESAIGRFFGYSEQAIEKHMNIYRWLKSPEGLAFRKEHGAPGNSEFDEWTPEIRAMAHSSIQEHAKLQRVPDAPQPAADAPLEQAVAA
jgi:hypothetical protein